MKVWIDQDLCTGDGLCEEIAPDVFVLLDDGLAYVREGATVFAEPREPAGRRRHGRHPGRPARHRGRVRRGVPRRVHLHRAVNSRPALRLRATPAAVTASEDAGDVVRLAGVLGGVVDDADQPHRQRHRRVPSAVDDAVEVLLGERVDDPVDVGLNRVVVAEQEVGGDPDAGDVLSGVPVAGRAVVEGQARTTTPSRRGSTPARRPGRRRRGRP